MRRAIVDSLTSCFTDSSASASRCDKPSARSRANSFRTNRRSAWTAGTANVPSRAKSSRIRARSSPSSGISPLSLMPTWTQGTRLRYAAAQFAAASRSRSEASRILGPCGPLFFFFFTLGIAVVPAAQAEVAQLKCRQLRSIPVKAAVTTSHVRVLYRTRVVRSIAEAAARLGQGVRCTGDVPREIAARHLLPGPMRQGESSILATSTKPQATAPIRGGFHLITASSEDAVKPMSEADRIHAS